MEQKPFAVGVRIEHSQEAVNKAQYGENYLEKYGDLLPVADYKLTAKTKDGRSVYTFCMCPGGYVINSSSEENRLCVNGMSFSQRDGENANSAIVAAVTPDDYASSDHPLEGITVTVTPGSPAQAYCVAEGYAWQPAGEDGASGEGL